MTVKMMLLTTGETIITDAKEVVQEEEVRGYLLTNPQIVRSQEKNVLMESESEKSNYELDVVLTPWMILSSDKEFLITREIVATICEPHATVKGMFESKTNVEKKVPLSETEVING